MSLKQSHELQKRIFEGADLLLATETMPELCKQIKIFVGHIPRRRTTKKCAEPEWNQVAREQEQYRDIVENKEENKVVEGEYYCVLPDKLAPREKVIYKCTIDYLQDKTGQWIERSKVVEHAVREGENQFVVQGRFTDMCLKQNKSFKTNLETTSGLLIKKVQNRWYIRLNS
jgi:hypothetical protein